MLRPGSELLLYEANWHFRLIKPPPQRGHIYEYCGTLPSFPNHFFCLYAEKVDGTKSATYRPSPLVTHKFAGVVLIPQDNEGDRADRRWTERYLLPISWAENLENRQAQIPVDKLASWWKNSTEKNKKLSLVSLEGEGFYLSFPL